MINGTYLAKITGHFTGYTKTQLPVIIMQLELTAMYELDSFLPLPFPQHIEASIYPVLKEGGVNQRAVDNTVQILDETEFNLEKLGNGAYVGTVVQAVIEEEEYLGKSRQKVKWLNHRNATPRRGRNAAEAQDIAVKYAAMFPVKRVAQAVPAAKPKPAVAASPEMKEAWAKFKLINKDFSELTTKINWGAMVENFESINGRKPVGHEWIQVVEAYRLPHTETASPDEPTDTPTAVVVPADDIPF